MYFSQAFATSANLIVFTFETENELYFILKLLVTLYVMLNYILHYMFNFLNIFLKKLHASQTVMRIFH